MRIKANKANYEIEFGNQDSETQVESPEGKRKVEKGVDKAK